jgi:hypothetical protein
VIGLPSDDDLAEIIKIVRDTAEKGSEEQLRQTLALTGDLLDAFLRSRTPASDAPGEVWPGF